MLQQNNNNNYPCLNMSGSTQEMLQKCSRAALPFPSRLELGDLPLIRGLRAWALCSRSRRKAGALLDGGRAPTAPHAGRSSSTSCPAPAGVYLSGERARTRYGLPLGLDARQAEVGALVTVASLKPSEGSGKTQTQCLFLQTEKGSCLYSTAKPGSGGTASAGSSVVGGWLRGKTGRGSRDTSAGRRDTGPHPPAHGGANRVRAGSGRRWRKSGCDRAAVSRERQQRSREDPGEVILEERKEVQDKGALDDKQLPRLPRCCHDASPKPAAQCRRRAQRRQSQEEHEGGESPSAGKKGARKPRQEEEGGVAPKPDSNPEDAEASGEAEGNVSDSDATHTGNDAETPNVKCASASRNQMQSTEERWSLASNDSGPDPVGAARLPESSAPLEGSIWKGEQLQGPPASQEQCVLVGPEEPDVSDDTVNVQVSLQRERNKTSASPLASKHPSSDCQTPESEPRHEPAPDAAGSRPRPGTWSEAAGANQEDVDDAEANWGLRESAAGDEKREDGGRRTSGSLVNVTNAACADPLTSPALSQANPAPPPPPLASMATGLPCVAPEAGGRARDGEGGREGTRRRGREQAEEETGATAATGGGREEEEEDDFGGFVQAEGESAWSEGCTTSASVPCGSGESVGESHASLFILSLV